VKPVISGNGAVFVSAGPNSIYRLDEATGAQVWTLDLSSIGLYATGSLAYANGTVYVPGFKSYPQSVVRGLDAKTGAFKTDSPFFGGQFLHLNSAVVFQDELFYTQGSSGGAVYKYSLPSGASAWTSAGVYSDHYVNQTPAVDKDYVYYSDNSGLLIYDKMTGALVADVAGPVYSPTVLQYPVAPVIASSGHVLINEGQNGARIAAVDPVTKTFVWRSGTSYSFQQPVVSGSTVYVVYTGASFNRIHALSDVDGSLLWSWGIPLSDLTPLIGNLIVCDNLLFVSSEQNVYAIDLKTHQTVWTYPAYGSLSISPGYVLHVVTNDPSSTSKSKVTAIRLT
jgi:outer membrane protein assembly factor BamB